MLETTERAETDEGLASSYSHQFNFQLTDLMLSIALPLVPASDSATADMDNAPLDNWLVLGTNADAVDAAATKSADRMETFLKNSIFNLLSVYLK